MPAKLKCPVCSQLLQPTDSGAACTSNHQFDRARQGYLNLLPSHKMRSKHPGDDKQMIQARNRFLDSGHYEPVINALVDATRTATDNINQPVILDAGCGEGYYTARLHDAFPQAAVCGFDISKPAIQACCRRSQSVQWLVASVNDIPIPDNQVDTIISVFSRCDWQEFGRVLKPGGNVLVLAPGEHHLYALRQVIYEEVRPYPVDKLVSQLPEHFELVENGSVKGTMNLNSSELILDLLAMTPHYWHVKPSQKQQLSELTSLACGIDMKLYTIAYQPSES
ncbi:hypothetical protein GZ77_25170 [Endozoicomonas montiporae]|uniref:Uncharacterized protein n=2 Tax=Endozoicomonas montiporae TaxID=1027273 RepID=A0A081MYY1_9GAMM|nr:methyltransferase domain-containing protein [Endozoicomonas montiporae]AMO54871.1 23S rRNA (guanine745-N1)-methyltransferase [Endozoicomonas montiporae CL-33]KEQ11404.1 hypothetical protein GZ77_25170 [Endozoicomonas montiporae]